MSDSELQRSLLLYVTFLVGVIVTFGYTTDDAFIPLRYAANLAHGYGLVFNPGQRVEGFTSPAGVVVALVSYVTPGGYALFKMKLFSVLFGLLAVREGARILQVLDLPLGVDRVALVTIGLSPVIAFGSANGLETSLEMWLLAAIASRLMRVDANVRNDYAVAAFAFAAVLTRLDAIVPLSAMALASLADGGPSRPWRRARWFLGGVVGSALSTLVAFAYYRSWFPNTFYAKRPPLRDALRAGFGYVKWLLQPSGIDPLRSHPAIPELVSWIEIALAIAGCVWIIRHFPRAAFLVTLCAGQAAFAVVAGGDWMAGGRFLAPAAVEFIVVEAAGVALLVRVAVVLAGPR
ncbi:MAG: hypothetical protein ACRDV0_06535, partial [Acidimicrobiales bacterium]